MVDSEIEAKARLIVVDSRRHADDVINVGVAYLVLLDGFTRLGGAG